MSKEVDRILNELAQLGVRPEGLAVDSRAVARGDVFLAYPGARSDGRRFVADAVARGAAAVLWERDGFAWLREFAAPNVAVAELKRLSGPLAAEVYGRPSEALWVVGVTGTNGKTSCSQWLAQALSATSRKCGVVGTLGTGFPGALEENANTTPDAVVLQQALKRFRDAGAACVALEASSIGLEQGRLDGTRITCALFTNLSRDHLEYHPDMEAYARGLGLEFKFDGLLNPRVDCGANRNSELQLDPERALELDLGSPERMEGFREFCERFTRPDAGYGSEKVYTCGAGQSSFTVDPYGRLQMCQLSRKAAFDLARESFATIWGERFGALRARLPARFPTATSIRAFTTTRRRSPP